MSGDVPIEFYLNIVSVIMPVYNNEQHIGEAITSVMAQTHSAWELLIVDDHSTDDSLAVAQRFAQNDARITVLQTTSNSGAAIARNTALAIAQGRYVAFLDADDRWYPEKLARQLVFMEQRGAAFSCTSYEVISEYGFVLDKQIRMRSELDYSGNLDNNLIQTVGVVVDRRFVASKYIEMPDLRRRQDAATWFQILKAGHICHGMPDILAQYRKVPGSLSSHKLKAIVGTWRLYRNNEQLPLRRVLRNFIRYATLAIMKRSYLLKPRNLSSIFAPRCIVAARQRRDRRTDAFSFTR